MIVELAHSYEAFKASIVPSDQDLRSLVHIHVGLAIWLGIVVLRRRGLSDWLPIFAITTLCLLGEAADLVGYWPVRRAWIWHDMAGDIFNTLFWPVLLWLYASWRCGRSSSSADKTAGDDIS
jgi:hypothetical protein